MPTCQTGPCAKLESDRADGAWYTTTGHPSDMSLSTTNSICSREAWFRAPNSLNRGVASPPPLSSSLLGAGAGNAEPTLSVANSCRVKNSAMPDPVCSYQRIFTSSMSEGVCWWITSLAGGSSSGELRAGRTGSTAGSTPLVSNGVKMVHNGVSANQHGSNRLCRTSAASNDECREGVRGGGQDGG